MREGMGFGTNTDIYNPDWRDVSVMYGDTIVKTESDPETHRNAGQSHRLTRSRQRQ
ncbi:hypothetical protein ACFQO4_18770 [Saliphagus sp. GCM10025334]